MPLEPLAFFVAVLVLTSLAMFVPSMVAARVWVGAPAGIAAVAVAAVLFVVAAGQPRLVLALAGVALLGTVGVRLAAPHWSWLGAQLMATVALGGLAYLAYAAYYTYLVGLGFASVLGGTVLLILEILVFLLSLSYIFEIVDVLSRSDHRRPPFDPTYRPQVAIQVPTHNEPVEVVKESLLALQRLDYPDFIVQVVDNNTPDPAVWRPLQQLCRELGDRFHFMHLDDWPGFKAGALNEATRRLPREVEILAVVDADYVVDPNFLATTVGYFVDPRVAFVQSPQDYRDWADDEYLRGLFFSYRYFFEITMPARAHRDAIIFAGTMGLIRRQALEAIGGWNPDCVTEDAEASLRLLGQGYSGVFVPANRGRGLMPLDFDGLKRQRFRWALGGIQLLRLHLPEMLPGRRHRLRLTTAQRLHYLLGGIQWFGDVLTICFTLLLLLTAFFTAVGHALPFRRMTGAVLVVPLVFIATGVARALWAMRWTTRCTWRDAFDALRVWFALSFVVSLACLRGLLSGKAAFLRTPKQRQGEGSWSHALRSCKVETALVVVCILGGVAMFIRAPGAVTGILALLLLFQAFIYSNAVWASLAAEGIRLTPQRQLYRSRYAGQHPVDLPAAGRTTAMIVPGLAAVLLFLGVLSAPVVTSPREPLPPAAPPGHTKHAAGHGHGHAVPKPSATATTSAGSTSTTTSATTSSSTRP